MYDIIVPNYVTPELAPMIVDCLCSIRQFSKDYRLILINNGSPSFKLIESEVACHSDRIVISVPQNLGFVKAVNLGIKISTAPYVVIMNNDTRVVANWLERLKGPLANPAVGLSGPRSNENNTLSCQLPYRRLTILPTGSMLIFFCVMIKGEVIERVGLLNEKFGVGLGDDDDYCHRAEAAGYRLAFVGDLEIYHKHKATFSTLYSDHQIKEMSEKALKLLRS